MDTQETISGTNVAIISTVLCFVFGAVCGFIIGALIMCFCKRRTRGKHSYDFPSTVQPQATNPPGTSLQAPVYDDVILPTTKDSEQIELKENVSYGPVQSRK